MLSSFRARLCPNCKAFLYGQACACSFVEIKPVITLDQYFKGPAPSAELEANAKDLLLKVNSLLAELGIQSVIVTSGYRSPEHNAKIGGAPNSNHCKALAIDLADNDRAIGSRLLTRQDLLKKRTMAMEALPYCARLNGNKWLHLQSVLPKSGNTVFAPYAGPPKLS